MGALRRLSNRCHDERGVELIEFALTFPLLLFVVLGIIEFGFVFREYEVVTNAAREGARVAGLPSFTATNARDRALAYLTASGLSTAGVPLPTVTPATMTLPGGACIATVAVGVSYPHPMTFVSGISSLFGSSLGTITLTATSTMRTETVAGCP
jgi:Flp pilus assembly protein TadG